MNKRSKIHKQCPEHEINHMNKHATTQNCNFTHPVSFFHRAQSISEILGGGSAHRLGAEGIDDSQIPS